VPQVLAALLLLGLGWAAYRVVDRRLPYYHFRTVTPGVFYRSGQMTPEQLQEAVSRYGVRTVINLRHEEDWAEWHQQERQTAARLGVRHVDIPLRGDEPPRPDHLPLLYEVFDDEANYPVLVHCHKGSIRSAALEGFYRREYLREGPEHAFDDVETWGHDLEAEVPRIAAFIRHYSPRRR
jgi:uncharacterized protein (TIGR01244 family)